MESVNIGDGRTTKITGSLRAFSLFDVQKHVSLLAAQLATFFRAHPDRRPMACVAVHSGGLIPAAMLWHALCDMEGVITPSAWPFYSVFAKSYSGQSQKDLTLLIPDEVHALAAKYPILIVDDIYDTGVTMKAIREQLDPIDGHQNTFAVLVSKDTDSHDWIFAGTHVHPNTWVEFPWE